MNIIYDLVIKNLVVMGNTGEMDMLFMYAMKEILIVNQKGLIVRMTPGVRLFFGLVKNESVDRHLEIPIPNLSEKKHKSYRHKSRDSPYEHTAGKRNWRVRAESNRTELPVQSFKITIPTFHLFEHLKLLFKSMTYEKENFTD